MTAASELFRRQGYAATGLKAILAASDAPYGSLYHFFPGGKEELGVAVLHSGGAVYRELVEAFFVPGGDVVGETLDVLRRRSDDDRGDRVRRRLPDRHDRARDGEHERTDASRLG